MAESKITKDQFACASCGEEYAHEASVAECRMCHRTYCDDCIDDRGLCIPCKEVPD